MSEISVALVLATEHRLDELISRVVEPGEEERIVSLFPSPGYKTIRGIQLSLDRPITNESQLADARLVATLRGEYGHQIYKRGVATADELRAFEAEVAIEDAGSH